MHLQPTNYENYPYTQRSASRQNADFTDSYSFGNQ